MRPVQDIRKLALIALLAGCVQPSEYGPRPAQTEAEIAFAKQVLDLVQARSFSENREYCGYIGLDQNGGFIATKARPGRTDSCRPRAPFGFNVLASYHSHGAYTAQIDTETPSVSDLRADIYEGIDGYIATPGGRVWYNDAAGEFTELLCGAGCIRTDTNFRDEYPMRPGLTLSLAELEAME